MNIVRLNYPKYLTGHLRIIVFAILIFTAGPIYCQNKDSTLIGSINGRVKDSAYNFMLTSATIAIYKDEDSSLLQFSLPNNFGEFGIQSLPTDISLRLIISHVGYVSLLKKFSIGSDKRKIDFETLYLHQNKDVEGNTLDEVVVKSIPPMRMNGDTVEFNSDAFRMNANATAEDLMRRLPGFTVWGDGEITYNGKRINAVFVEGKPFMGSSDPTVATQNLPKDALDKIQVYQQPNDKNPLDSTLFANIKLKENKKTGLFGKISAGYGTDKRYTADGMLSGFNKKLQFNTVGAVNNINKLANSVDVLIKNSSFKGEGTNMDYQSNFSLRGLNKPAAAGVKVQYDFVPDVKYRKSSRLNLDYFLSTNSNNILNNSLINNFLEADTIISRNSESKTANYTSNQKINSRYSWDSENANFIFTSSISQNFDKNAREGTSQQEKTGIGVISSTIDRNRSEILNRTFTVGIEYTNRVKMFENNIKRVSREFSIGYNLLISETDGNSVNQTSYKSNVNSQDNRVFDRFYNQRNSQGTIHQFTASYPGIKRLIFNNANLGGIQITLSAALALKNDNYTDEVLDIDSLSQTYQINNYLSNVRNAETQDIQPALNVSRTFYKDLTNRYNKWLSIHANLKQQYFSMDHRATSNTQNFSYNYRYFIPDASLEYNNHQYGSYEVKYNLGFLTSVNYPGVNNISPLIDSSNVWYIPIGNPLIKPQYKEDLNFTYTLATRTPKNPATLNLKIGIGKIENNITDSSIYNNSGVRTVYNVNMDGNKYFESELGLKKSFELKKNTSLEAYGRYNILAGQTPQYINSIPNISKNLNHNIVVNIGFRLKDLLNVKVEQHYGKSNSLQKGFNNNQFNSTNAYTRFIGSLKFPTCLSWNMNITYNLNDNNNSKPIHFTIWNASLTYRFLRGDNGEIKFSALDLLKQNKGVLNAATTNTQTFTSTNVLQQYFLISFSYYPRKFGRKNTSDNQK